jgi:hypothetical protein
MGRFFVAAVGTLLKIGYADRDAAIVHATKHVPKKK